MIETPWLLLCLRPTRVDRVAVSGTGIHTDIGGDLPRRERVPHAPLRRDQRHIAAHERDPLVDGTQAMSVGLTETLAPSCVAHIASDAHIICAHIKSMAFVRRHR